eukprot:g2318.t1
MAGRFARNIFHWIFDLMDVKETCRYDDTGGRLISYGTFKQDDRGVLVPPRKRIIPGLQKGVLFTFCRGHLHRTSSIRAETAKKGGFKGVMTIRNPLEMVVSSYCYHHRGAEPWNALGDNMTDLAPKEGVPEMARRMLLTVRNMTHAFQAAKPEVYVSHYERITGSSAGFNQTIKEIGGTRRALGSSVRNMTADDRGLHRGEEGFSFHVDGTADGKMGNDGVNHTSDEQELDEARAHLSLLDQDGPAAPAAAAAGTKKPP